MSNTENKNGKLLTFYELLSGNQKITIPIIQRDYAQGRDEQPVEEIRDLFLDTLFSAVKGDEDNAVILDFVYGSMNLESFIPIDGQQRLTTLFLLHWYLAVSEKRDPLEYRYLTNFSYEIRENAEEFCNALASHYVDLYQDNDNPSAKIRKANWYHKVYDSDPTVQAMLRMLDAIDKKFRNFEGGYKNLVEKQTVTFWWLSLDDFGLTDDLFIKMNARGKNLTRFEKFKVDAEKQTVIFEKDAVSKKQREHWLNNIDNDWLDMFWANSVVPEEKAENEMFRFILFILRSLASETSGKYEEITQLEFADTKNDIKTLCEAGNFEFLCKALDLYDSYFEYIPVQGILKKIIGGEYVPYYERALVFGMIAYGNTHPGLIKNELYYRILKYLVIGQRHVREDSKKFESDLNAQGYGLFIRNLRLFIADIPGDGSLPGLLRAAAKAGSGMARFQHLREKAEYCLDDDGNPNQSSYNEICAMEDMDCFCGQIHNVLFDGKLWLSPQKMEQLTAIQKTNPRLLLQCIQAMAGSSLLTDKYYGSWKWVIFSGQEYQFTLRRKFYGFSKSDSGDYLWTADTQEKLKTAVREFVKECAGLPFTYPEKELSSWLAEKVEKLTDYTRLASYIVKYHEFLGNGDEKTDGCVYLGAYYTLVGNDSTRIFDNLEFGQSAWLGYGRHYNPFVMALRNRLDKIDAAPHIVNYRSSKKEDGSILEEWIELSNGRKMRLLINAKSERYWIFDDGVELDCGNTDCIETVFNKIMEI